MSASTPASSGCPFGGADCACATGPAPAGVALAAASWPAANAAPCGSSTTLATRRKETAGITIGIRGRILDLLHARAAKKNRSEEHTSELQSLMRISYAVFCLKKKTKETYNITTVDTKTIVKKQNQTQ